MLESVVDSYVPSVDSSLTSEIKGLERDVVLYKKIEIFSERTLKTKTVTQ